MLNLLSNAVKFTEVGDVVVRVEAGPVVKEGPRVVQVSVSDSGIGISAAALPRLFAPFSQEDSSITRRFGGTGLGLAISRKLLSLMGGIIDVTSAPGGTTFTFALGFTVVEPAASSLELSRVRVGVVALRASEREAVLRSLQCAGATTRVFRDVAEAQARGHEVEALLVDAELGPDAVKALCALPVAVGVMTPVSKAVFTSAAFTVHRPLRRKQLVATLARAPEARPRRSRVASSAAPQHVRRYAGVGG